MGKKAEVLLTQAAIVGEKLSKFLTVLLAVSTAAAVTPRRQADASRLHVIGRHHRPCRGQKLVSVSF